MGRRGLWREVGPGGECPGVVGGGGCGKGHGKEPDGSGLDRLRDMDIAAYSWLTEIELM